MSRGLIHTEHTVDSGLYSYLCCVVYLSSTNCDYEHTKYRAEGIEQLLDDHQLWCLSSNTPRVSSCCGKCVAIGAQNPPLVPICEYNWTF